MKNRIVLLLFAIILNNTYAQVEVTNPPSANSTILGNYANVPISLFSGTTDIKVPIWTLKAGDFSLPIYLSYQSTGIRVEQESGIVGLGWALNTGGIITRSARDYPDEDYDITREIVGGEPVEEEFRGIMNLDVDIYNAIQSFTDDNSELDNWKENNYDTEPDIFFYNFLNRTGKFIMTSKREFGQIPYRPFKIVPIYLSDYFNLPPGEFEEYDFLQDIIITDDDGVKYYFSDWEVTIDKTFSERDYVVNNFSPMYPYSYTNTVYNSTQQSCLTAWYLTKIVTASGEVIILQYKRKNYNRELRLLEYGLKNGSSEKYNRYQQYHGIETRMPIIESISYKDTKILFTHSTDDNLCHQNDRIDNIEIYYGNELIKRFDLNYEYFISDGIEDVTDEEEKKYYRRSYLKSIEEKSENSDESLKTEFEYYYDNELKLPNLRSCEQDIWGYYNGNEANHLIPEIYIYPDKADAFRALPIEGYSGETYTLEGADRKPNADLSHANMLKQINYPTGGYQKFVYEPHTYEYDGQTYQGGGLRINSIELYDGYSHINDQITKYNYENDNGSTSGVLFTKPQFANLSLLKFIGTDGKYYYYDKSEMTNLFNHKDANGNFDKRFDFYDKFLKRWNLNMTPLGSIGQNIGYKTVTVEQTGNGKAIYNYSTPGAYLDIDDNPEGNCSVDVNGFCDGLYEATVENSLAYSYQNEYSNCSCALPYYYVYPYSPQTNYDWNRGKLLSVSYFDKNDNPVKSIENNYKTIYKNNTSPVPIYGINVKMEKMEYVDATGFWAWLSGVLAGSRPQSEDAQWAFGKYKLLYNMAKVPESTIETFYKNANETVSTEKFFSYNDFGQVTLISQERSDNSYTYTGYVYPTNYKESLKQYESVLVPNASSLVDCIHSCSTDAFCIKGCFTEYNQTINAVFSDETTQAIAAMYYRNMLSPVVEEVKLSDAETVIASSINKYKAYSNGIIKPSSLLFLETEDPITDYSLSTINANGVFIYDQNRLKPVSHFEKYDIYGNLLQFRKSNDIPTTIIYGYNNSLPVAKIVGADYEAIENVFSKEELVWINEGSYSDSELRDKLADLRTELPATAFVTSYTYKPLVGMTSETDAKGVTTYYIYDDFGRLEKIIDDDGNIRKAFKYHYAE